MLLRILNKEDGGGMKEEGCYCLSAQLFHYEQLNIIIQLFMQ